MKSSPTMIPRLTIAVLHVFQCAENNTKAYKPRSGTRGERQGADA